MFDDREDNRTEGGSRLRKHPFAVCILYSHLTDDRELFYLQQQDNLRQALLPFLRPSFTPYVLRRIPVSVHVHICFVVLLRCAELVFSSAGVFFLLAKEIALEE